MPGRRGTGGLGLFLLGMQLINLFNYFSQQNEYLPVTIGVLAVNLLAYFQPGSHGWPSIQQASSGGAPNLPGFEAISNSIALSG